MPSIYAHNKFGLNVFKTLPVSIQNEIQQEKSMYLIGQQGAELLSFNNSYLIASQLQSTTDMDFFEKSLSYVKTSKELAYILGMICHFTLESQCNQFIKNYHLAYHILPSEIESEFDRKLMLTDGFNPLTGYLVKDIKPTLENASAIQTFFPEMKLSEIETSLHDMIKYDSLPFISGKRKRSAMYLYLFITGNYKKVYEPILNYHPNPSCYISNFALGNLFHKAIPTAVSLVQNYMDVLENGGNLSERFSYHCSML